MGNCWYDSSAQDLRQPFIFGEMEMNKVVIDKLVLFCLRDCISTANLPTELANILLKQLHPAIHDFIILFIKRAEENYFSQNEKNN